MSTDETPAERLLAHTKLINAWKCQLATHPLGSDMYNWTKRMIEKMEALVIRDADGNSIGIKASGPGPCHSDILGRLRDQVVTEIDAQITDHFDDMWQTRLDR